MLRSPYYMVILIGLLLVTLFWLAARGGSAGSSWSRPYGSCSCAEDIKDGIRIKPHHSLPSPSTTPSTSPSQPKNSAAATPTRIDQDLPLSRLTPQSYYLPFRPSHQLARLPFPAKVWHKAGPNGISEDRQKDMQSWLALNPSLRHETFTDGSAEYYVKEKFAKFPEIIDTYQDMQVPILKADFLRQLILYAEGGVWSDLDVTCHEPIDTWIPEEYKNKTNLVVGLEFDGNQFASWTIMAKPRTNHIASVIDYIVEKLDETALRANTTVAKITMKDIEDVVALTGPQAMTQAIFRSLSIDLGQPISGIDVADLRAPILLHDVLVLPNAAFAAMQGDWPEDRGPYLVEHHYAGSWKNDDGGESSTDKAAESANEQTDDPAASTESEEIKSEIRNE
ncbi:Alpha-1,6-mannosyltransferase [Penicillium ucsense]|uniref:Alpha-1,6-mannosyltransferase n=1 Tax=Penicillium ucsense TaxID=2839758 RepID=A0A8J8WI47_9EURO|nr:Alpha-1,6-mannosyltransferase [Penicillium ucsense]KAF7734453.1 Alpha-1,6-mannosyltransferase [Penicillium ucsense]